MDDLSSIISSLSKDDISKLQDMANSIFGSNDNTPKEQPKSESNGISPDNLSVINAFIKSTDNSNDEKTAFIKSLKPLLSPERRHKADEAIKIMQIFKLLPLLKDQGIL